MPISYTRLYSYPFDCNCGLSLLIRKNRQLFSSSSGEITTQLIKMIARAVQNKTLVQ